MEIEARLAKLEGDIECLFSAIVGIAEADRKYEFGEKWGPKIREIEADQKTLYGDGWDELGGIWNFVESKRREPDFDETAVVDGYINSVKQKFAKLRGIVEDAKEAVEDSGAPEQAKQIAENHLEIAENAVETAEDALSTATEETATDEGAMAAMLGEHPMFRAGMF